MSSESFMMRMRASWLARRNRVLANSSFQRRAAAFPLTRPVARFYAGDLFDLTAGFVHAQTAAALVDSGLLAALTEAPLTEPEIAGRTVLPAPAARALLQAAEALALVERVGVRWTLGRRGAALAGSPGVAEMIAHHALFYADLADPLAMLRGEGPGHLARLWRYGGGADAADVAAYSRLMAASQPMVAAQALASYDFSRHHALLDIGGGAGAFLGAIGVQYPALALGLFDLPAVLATVPPRPSLAFHPGDFRVDPLPEGYDLVTLVRILHDHDDSPAFRLLATIRAALPPGGRLLIVEPMAGRRGAAASVQAYFSLYLAAMGSGRPRTAREIKAMLRRAGFRRARRLATPLPLIASSILADT